MRLASICAVVVALGFSASGAVAAAVDPVASVALIDLQLPTFQQAALAADEPVQDLLLEPTGVTWLLGRTSLWRWAAESKSLKRLKFGDPKLAEQDVLRHLGTDGLSVFAAGEGALYQAQWTQGRVFRYPLQPKAPTFGFAGFGDDFWLVQATGLFQFDRYGRTLQPKSTGVQLSKGDLTYFDTQRKTLWVARKTKLIKQVLGGSAPVVTLNASHRLLGIAPGDNELILHTAHAVLRVDSNGKLKGSIPVESRRKLVSMNVTKDAHAYLFDDNLLEIYDVKKLTVTRYRLPLEGVTEIKALAISGSFVALLADGRPRTFKRQTQP